MEDSLDYVAPVIHPLNAKGVGHLDVVNTGESVSFIDSMEANDSNFSDTINQIIGFLDYGLHESYCDHLFLPPWI